MTTHDAEPQGALDPMVTEMYWALSDAFALGIDCIPEEGDAADAKVQDLMRQLTERLAAHDQSDRSEGERE